MANVMHCDLKAARGRASRFPLITMLIIPPSRPIELLHSFTVVIICEILSQFWTAVENHCYVGAPTPG